MREKGAREIVDYKFYCFDGEPVYCQVIKDRNTNETIDFYDMDWNWMNFTRIHQGNQRYPHSAKKQSAPATFPEMKEFSKKLANGLPFARVDYYCINGKTYFGEITLYPAAGFGEFSPESANFEMGEKISLPENGGGDIEINELKSKEILAKNDELTDYKFFCFNGYVDCVMICMDRNSGDTKYYFFDENWKLLRLNTRGKNAPPGFTLPKPKLMDEMFSIASTLSKGLPYVRVDLYQSGEQIYFGELTFFPASGFDANLLEEADKRFGDLIDLTLDDKEEK
ncbi:MAG: ATP-grasp fold amidoligase family protein [Oscillospiraceae bacterium]|nr:ATP-grasp fold amidoligase family protein [Oscillospiraceae bacterium]